MTPIISSITSGQGLGRTPPSPTFEITASALTADETTSKVVNFSVATTNIPDGVTLYYTLSGSGITSSDFEELSTFGSFIVNSNSGSFSFTVAEDYFTEGNETVTVSLRRGSLGGLIVDTVNVLISDTSLDPTFTITPSTTTLNEGATVSFTIYSDAPVEIPIYYTPDTITGAIRDDDFDGVGFGSTTIGGSAGDTKVVSLTLRNDYVTEGEELFVVHVRQGGFEGGIYTTSSEITVSDTSVYPSFTITPSQSSVPEGGTINFVINTSGAFIGYTAYYTIELTGATSDDFISPLQGSFVIDGTATNTVSIGISEDQTTEGSPESFVLQIRGGAIDGDIIETSSVIVINDTSQDPTYSFGTIPTSINEGSPGTFNVVTTDIFDGTTLYWDITNAGEFTSPTSGSITITSNAGSFQITPTLDQTTEGPETFVARIYTDSERTNLVATSNSVTINDTSQDPTYSFGTIPTSINEGSVGTFNVVTTDLFDGTTLYWDITNTGEFTGATSGSITITSNAGSFDVIPFSDKTSEGPETFVARIYTDSERTNLVATSNSVTINDTSQEPTYTIVAPASVEEGIVGIATVVTTNVDDGTVLYWDINVTSANFGSDFAATSGTVTITSNTGSISLEPTIDVTTTENDTFVLNLYVDSARTIMVATTGTPEIPIIDYQFTWRNYHLNQGPRTGPSFYAYEGNVYHYEVNAGLPEGTVVYYRVFNRNESSAFGNAYDGDFVDPTTLGFSLPAGQVITGGGSNICDGTFTISAGVGTFAIGIYSDTSREGQPFFSAERYYVNTYQYRFGDGWWNFTYDQILTNGSTMIKTLID